ncbi:MAG TPA: DUF72 domain-containing protein [Bryobacteraceae bacterium]|jgi:uncharacterized protein YecE (DUF72 family)
MLPLFDEESRFDRARLAARLEELRRAEIFIGTSSWKYEGWLDQIYSRERYSTRGRFSSKRFEQECLAEYSEIFPIVCGDFSFYQFPPDSYWTKLFGSAPERLQFALKVPEEITVRQFPVHPRYGARAGFDNESFLNSELLENGFLRPLEPFRERVPLLLFEFGAFRRGAMPSPADFVKLLDPFLARLPDHFRYGVEIRSPEFLGPEYFGCLRDNGVAHVFNAWTRMPEIGLQMEMEDAYTAGFTVARALLRKGRAYEEAVRSLAPYTMTQDVNVETRSALRGLIERAREKRQPSFMFVNNRLEGNAPLTIEAIV